MKKRAKKKEVKQPTIKGLRRSITVLTNRLEAAEKARIKTEITYTARMAELVKQEQMAKFVWTTASGDVVQPKNMDEDHLRNTISYLSRRLISDLGRQAWIHKLHYFVKALDAML